MWSGTKGLTGWAHSIGQHINNNKRTDKVIWRLDIELENCQDKRNAKSAQNIGVVSQLHKHCSMVSVVLISKTVPGK